MMKRILAGATSATLVATLLSPVAFAATLEISGNGDGSTNTINVTQNNPGADVDQKNVLVVEAVVISGAFTGSNTANGNTTNGGDVTIDTGKATSFSSLDVTGGNAQVTISDPCGCSTIPETTISGNGVGSNNTVTVKTNKKPSKKVTQRNRLRVSALVESVAGTDLNDTSNNTTNGGNVGVTTDNADAASMMVVTGGHATITL